MCWTSQSSKRYKAKKNLTKYVQINMKYDENSNKDLARITHNVRNNTGRCSTEKSENKKKRGQRRKVRRGEVVLITISIQRRAQNKTMQQLAAGFYCRPTIKLGTTRVRFLWAPLTGQGRVRSYVNQITQQHVNLVCPTTVRNLVYSLE